MDKSWTHHERISATYRNGVKTFIDHVRATMGPTVDIRCPCIKCMNLYTITQEEVSTHLCINGIMPTYDKWIYHGEPIPHKSNEHGEYINSQNEEFMDYDSDGDEDEFETLMEDINRGNYTVNGNEEDTFQDRNHTRFEKMVYMLNKELYPGCKKYSILSFVIKLLHLKVFNHWTNKSIDMLLELMKDVLPDAVNLPKSYYEAKTMLREIGYEAIQIGLIANLDMVAARAYTTTSCVWHMIQNDLVHGWGLDLALQKCVEPAHEKIGVVDAQWIVHQGVPSLREQGQVENGKQPWQGVRERCKLEWIMLKNRFANAEKDYYKSMGIE